MREHKLKCWKNYYEAVETGEKNFEVRRDDRGFQKGDIVILQCWDQENGGHYVLDWTKGSSRFDREPKSLRKIITYVLTGGQFGIQAGFVVLGLADAN